MNIPKILYITEPQKHFGLYFSKLHIYIRSVSLKYFGLSWCHIIRKMADQTKIKLFQSLRKYFQILGTLSPDSDQNRPFNRRNVFVLFFYIQMFASVLAFTLLKAQTVAEFGLNYYGYMTELVCISAISLQIYRKIETFKLISNCEEFVEKSKLKKLLVFLWWFKNQLRIDLIW